MRAPPSMSLHALLLAAALPLAAPAATLVVPTQYPTIQSAMDSALPLDVVVVEPALTART
jgi:hypothetical protein